MASPAVSGASARNRSVVMVAASHGQATGSLTHTPRFALPHLSPERACTRRPSGPSTVGPKSVGGPAGAGAVAASDGPAALAAGRGAAAVAAGSGAVTAAGGTGWR